MTTQHELSPIRYCTFTGIDASTDFERVVALSTSYPFLEWGVLYSPVQAGSHPRYMSMPQIQSFVERAESAGVNVALHVCGDGVREALTQSNPALEDVLNKVGRTQLNLDASAVSTRALGQDLRGLRGIRDIRVILQWNDRNEAALRQLRSDGSDFEFVIDASLGRGVTPTSWPSRDELGMTGRPMGYAGGLGPHNIAEQLPLINAAAAGRLFWIDMESGVRTPDDKLDLDKCERVAQTVSRHGRDAEMRRGMELGTSTVDVAGLSGFWLEWWAGAAMGHDMLIPPKDASRPVYVNRYYGTLNGFDLHSAETGLMEILSEHQVGLEPRADSPEPWGAWATPRSNQGAFTGTTPVEAVLRAVVAKEFGARVPQNPAAVVSRYVDVDEESAAAAAALAQRHRPRP